MRRRGNLSFSLRCRIRNRCLILSYLFLVLLTPHVIWARGQPEENPIESAEALVEEGRINEAILLLEETVRENPDRIEQAEALMERILSIRKSYSDLFADLIDHLENRPEDIETTLDIIAQMEALDEHPNERVVAQITEARLIAQLAYDRNLAEEIVNGGERLIAGDDYAEAVSLYLTGFDLQTEIYSLREYPASFYESAADARQGVEQAAGQFLALAPNLSRATDAIVSALSYAPGAPVPTRAALDQVVTDAVAPFEAVHGTTDRVLEEGATLDALREQVAEFYPDDPVDWHLTFVDTFSTGRPGFEGDGISGAMEVMLEDSRNRVVAAAERAAGTADEARLAAADRGNWTEAQRTAVANADRYESGADIWLVHGEVPLGGTYDEAAAALPEEARDGYVVQVLRSQAYRRIAESYDMLAAVDAVIQQTEPTIAGLLQRREAAAQQRAELLALIDTWESDVAALSAPEGIGEAIALSREPFDRELALRAAQATETELVSLAAATDTEYQLSAATVQESRLSFREAESLLEGQPQSVVQADGTTVSVTYRYPGEALELLEDAEDRLVAVQEGIEELLDRFENEPPYVLADERVIDDIAQNRELLATTVGLLGNVREASVQAEDQVRLASELRSEGDALVAQARNAVARDAVLVARDLWAEAREAYFDSLEIQQDPEFRAQADETIVTLGAQIQEAENRIVVARVRELLIEARNQYDSEQFLEARQTLIEARETWARTNVSENPEIVRLLGFVSAALTLADKRNLEETEPLYPVLSNYLNLAKEDFNQAQSSRVGGTEGGMRVLIARADENLDNVLAVRPQNWEARVLKLRLLQLQDAENFNQAFASRVQAALNQRNENPEEALTSLETLREINPNYPGLEEAIVQLEIDLGIRPNPVTQRQVARSNELLAEARSLAGGGEAQNLAAIALLEQSLGVNPENSQAQLLLDRLRISAGGEASVALSSTDEQRFRRAETLFIQGNLGQALAIVQSLLQNPNNQQYPPLLDLRDRITSRLGI